MLEQRLPCAPYDRAHGHELLEHREPLEQDVQAEHDVRPAGQPEGEGVPDEGRYAERGGEEPRGVRVWGAGGVRGEVRDRGR